MSSEYAVRQAMGIEHHVRDITCRWTASNYAARDMQLQKTLVPSTSGLRLQHLPSRRPAGARGVQHLHAAGRAARRDDQEEAPGHGAFRTITAFANIKIRARMLPLRRPTAGPWWWGAATTEYLLGDFCRHGDGGTQDIEPLARNRQVYQIAHHLRGDPEVIVPMPGRTPSACGARRPGVLLPYPSSGWTACSVPGSTAFPPPKPPRPSAWETRCSAPSRISPPSTAPRLPAATCSAPRMGGEEAASDTSSSLPALCP